MTLRLTTEIDARNILDYFNGFHDGFIQEVSLRSYDSFAKEGPEITDIAHHCTGRFDAVIDIAHYNYQSGTQPYHRVVRCQFKHVKDFYVDLRDVKSYEWPIKVVEIQPGQRHNEHGGMESCFSLVFSWSKLVDNQWSERRGQVCTFREAEFSEH